jgi:hypothetical protein
MANDPTPTLGHVAYSPDYVSKFTPLPKPSQGKPPPSKIIGADHPEAICQDCGLSNVVWFTPSEYWNKVVRRPDKPDPMLCPRCFILRAESQGFEGAWKVLPD